MLLALKYCLPSFYFNPAGISGLPADYPVQAVPVVDTSAAGVPACLAGIVTIRLPYVMHPASG